MSYVAVGVSVALAVAGTAINYENQQATAKKADNIEAQNIESQTALDKKANQDTQAMLQKDAANDNDNSQKSSLLSTFQKAVAANQGNATGGLNQVGNVSGAYTKAANDAALGISNYANTQSTNLAGMDAPGLQRQSENANLAAYGSQIGGISQQSAGDAGVANIQLQGVQQNPWLSGIASGLSAAGSSGMGGMLTGGGSTASAYNGIQYANGANTPTIGGLMVNTTPAG